MTNFCRKCQKENPLQSRFCRYCGDPLVSAAGSEESETLISPRPYLWNDEPEQKTQQRQVRSTVEHIHMPQNPGMLNPGLAQPLAMRQNFVPGNYRCPNCGTTYLPVIERRISTAGWITFALLLVFTFIFFWIGLLIKEDVSICPVCRYRLNP